MNATWKKNVLLFLASQNISLFGTSLVQYAIMWHVTLETQSGATITAFIVCGFLPTFLLSPFSGVWADRYHRKNLIILADGVIAVATLVLMLLFRMGYNSIWLLFAVSIVRAIGSGIQNPAVGALLPQIVPENKLMRVNATNSSVQSVVNLVSPMVSGALLTATSLDKVLLVDVVTAAVAISILVLAVRVPSHARASGKVSTSYVSDLREGIGYVRTHPYLLRFCLFNIIFLFLVAPLAFLTPLQVARSFGDDVWRLTAIEVTFSGGMILGGVIMASWGGLRNRVHTMVLANFLIGACTIALGVVPFFSIYLAIMALAGIALPVFNTPAMVLLQQKVEDSYRGRVFGVLGMISSSMMPLGMLVFGPIADALRIEWLLLGTGFLINVMSLAMLRNKVMVEAGEPPAVPQTA